MMNRLLGYPGKMALRSLSFRAAARARFGGARMSMVTLPNDNEILSDADQQGGRRKLELDQEAKGLVSKHPSPNEREVLLTRTLLDEPGRLQS